MPASVWVDPGQGHDPIPMSQLLTMIVTLNVYDDTALVRNDPAADLTASKTWTLNVATANCGDAGIPDAGSPADAGAPDAGSPDAGAPIDAGGPPFDAGGSLDACVIRLSPRSIRGVRPHSSGISRSINA